MNSRILRIILRAGSLAILAGSARIPLSLADSPPKAPAPDVPKYAPLTGITGYQEIKLSDDSWYVAFYGNRKHEQTVVDAAWSARAAQLCQGIKRPFFVELRYVSEPVLTPAKASEHQEAPDGQLSKVGAVYVPIFIPQVHGPMAPVLMPGKSAAIRCVESPDALLDQSRAVSAVEAIAAAKKRGLAVQ